MPRAIVNVAAGDSVAGLILRQKRDIERLEDALERILYESNIAMVHEIAREALGEVPDAG